MRSVAERNFKRPVRQGQTLAEYLERERTCSCKGRQGRSRPKKEGTELPNAIVSTHSALHSFAVQPEEGPVEIRELQNNICSAELSPYVCKANVC